MAESNETKYQIFYHIKNLSVVSLRRNALNALSQIRYNPEIGLYLWQTSGAVASLLQEITGSYVALLSNNLSVSQSHTTCCALSLLQSIAAHPEARVEFVKSELMRFVLPILNNSNHLLPVEHMRLSVLGIIAELLKNKCNEALHYFTKSGDVLPQIYYFLEFGSEMSKAITSYILWRLLEFKEGLEYFTATEASNVKLLTLLAKIVYQLTLEPEKRILKNIISCYMRLADSSKKIILRHFPKQLSNGYFEKLNIYTQIKDDLVQLNMKMSACVDKN